MKKISILFIYTICLLQISFAQKEMNRWVFGDNAGLDFTNGIPVATISHTNAGYDGTCSICDNNGHFLFYSDGANVWNGSNNLMPNGAGLFGNNGSG